MTDPSVPKNRIDMTLRLWSEHVLLEPVLEQLNVSASHLHVVGQPMAKEGPLASKLARRHYASVTNVAYEVDADVSAWCRFVMNKIISNPSVADLLNAGEIEGILWISVLGPEPAIMPNIARDVVAIASQLKLSVLVENYTHLNAEVPEKVWLNRPITNLESEI